MRRFRCEEDRNFRSIDTGRSLPFQGVGIFLLLALPLLAIPGCTIRRGADSGEKVLVVGRFGVAGSSDPNDLGSMYDLDLANLVYDTLYEYEYLARPYKLRPAMAAAMPEVSEDGLTYTIRIRPGQYYIDDPCFTATGGKGREAVVRDFITNLYRKADLSTNSQSWWLVDGIVEGLNELRERYRGKPFDYDAEIPGLVAIDDYTLQLRLTRPFPQIMWILAMPGMALYPLECARYYGQDFGNHPVGTGPFRLVEWRKNARYVLVRNEKYREDRYPTEGTEEDRIAGRLEDAGKRIPFADRVIVHEFSQAQPYWLQFRAGMTSWTRVPGEFTEEVFQLRGREGNKRIWVRDARGERILREKYARKYRYYPLPLLDFIYRGFNFDDPVVGGKAGLPIRQALDLSYDIHEANDLFYNGLNRVYAGIIPPGLAGFDPNLEDPTRGVDLERARRILAEAGHPGGQGIPELQLCTSEDARTVAQAVHFQRGAQRIGLRVRIDQMRFAELTRKLKEGRCQMMGLAWGADWPDAQNFIQLVYGPNRSPGSNNMNYDNPVVNALYEKASVMPDSPERNAIYRQINRIVLEDVVFLGSMARTRDYLIPFGTKNFKPEEMFHNHEKYVRLERWGAPAATPSK